MSQLALYRKYRSAKLSDVVGQDHITKTLAASLKKGKLSHAYLFTGPRGVGKTSVARILAREVNGVSPSIDENRELDIIEIDAASNRGIDEIRSLREKITSAPSSLKYKVYIIDEAHMLTREAFNALLKTLEEPPAHALFILATTEAHKLPETIISRTQRYDFRPLTTTVLSARLRFIADQEKITITDDAIEAIAEMSAGGLRDAISLLDQISVLDGEISRETIQQYLGLATHQQLDELLTMTASDSSQALELLTQHLQEGIDPHLLVNQLQERLREQLLTSTTNPLPEPLTQAFLVRALEELYRAKENFAVSAHRSLPLELAIVKLTTKAQPTTVKAPPEISQSIPEPAKKSTKPATTQPAKQPETKAVSAGLDDVSACTKGLSLIKEHNNSLYALLRSGNARIEQNKLVVDCRFNFHKERISEHRNREFIEKVMGKVCGRDIILDCQLQQKETKEPVKANEELVSSAMAILGGELVDG